MRHSVPNVFSFTIYLFLRVKSSSCLVILETVVPFNALVHSSLHAQTEDHQLLALVYSTTLPRYTETHLTQKAFEIDSTVSTTKVRTSDTEDIASES